MCSTRLSFFSPWTPVAVFTINRYPPLAIIDWFQDNIEFGFGKKTTTKLKQNVRYNDPRMQELETASLQGRTEARMN